MKYNIYGRRLQDTHMFTFQVIKKTGCIIHVIEFPITNNTHDRVIGPSVKVLSHDRFIFIFRFNYLTSKV